MHDAATSSAKAGGAAYARPMPLNAAAMTAAGAGLASAITHLAIHTALPDAVGSNQSAAARQPVTWTNTGGDLTSGSKSFTGGAANGPATYVGFWSALTGGTFYGYAALTGDQSFNSAGQYTINSVTGWAHPVNKEGDVSEIAIHPTAVVVKWPAADVPVGASVEVSLDNGDTWHAGVITAGNVEVLVAPDHLPGPGVHRMFVRFADGPEWVVLDGGFLVVD